MDDGWWGWDADGIPDSDNDICGCGDTIDRIDEDCLNYAQHIRDLGL